MDRGLWFATGERSRKGMTLLWAALFVFSLLLQSVSAIAPAGVTAASGLKAGTVQGFEVDGDLASGNGASNPGNVPAALIDSLSNGVDWLDANATAGVVDPASPPTSFIIEDPINSSTDDVYSGGTKETDTRDWAIQSGPKPPSKDDIHHAMAYAKFVGNSAFFYAGATRIVNKGDTHIDFELNRLPFKTWADGVSKPNRSVGDVLISLEFSNGGADPIITVYKVTAVVNDPNGQETTFGTDLATAAAVHSATNFDDLPDQGLGYAIPELEFAETSVDLSALGINTSCPGLSTGFMRTRAGGDLDSSQLKDAIAPFPIDLNNCGKVTIIKDAVPNSAQDFAFTTTGGSSLSDFKLDDDNDNTLSDTKLFTQVVPGNYTVTEGTVDGWSLTGLTCNDEDGSVSKANRTATLAVGPNENITCTFTNTKLGTIIVEKQTNPDGASGSFNFTGDAAGSIGDGGQIVVNDLLPGTYTSTEGDPIPGFDLGAITCDDSGTENSTGNVGTRTATFHLEAGETVKCVFTNVQRGAITIIKNANPNDAQDFGFTATGAGVGAFTLDDDGDNANTLSNTKNFPNLIPGSFSVTESDVSGWELTDLTCNGTNGSTGVKSGSTANITLTPGGGVVCTYTNTKAGHILIDKVTNPAGDAASFEFDPSYSANNFSLTDAATPNDSGDLRFGVYSVAELAKAGWDLTSATCSDGSPVTAIDLQPGETVTCTFTNTKRGHIIIDKVTVPGGDSQLFTFTPSYNGGQTFQLADATTPNDSGALVPGTYSVSEAAIADWNLTGATCDDQSPVSAISLQPGETVTCTFTNTKRGQIIIDKVTVPGGDSQLFTFTPSYNGGQTFQLADATAPNNSGGLVPGTYSVAEGAIAGWDLTSATCSDQSPVRAISLQAGETVTCTFTNTKRGHIIIDKVTDPAGDPASFEFDPSYSTSNFSLTDAATPNDSGALEPGSYSVAELGKAGWDLTSATCSDQSPVTAISLQPGETVTCTFTNTKRGTIIVEKQTSPDGAAGSFTFAGDAAGSIGDGGQIVVGNLVPGTYTSSETDPGPGFDLGAIVCDDGDSATASSGDLAKLRATFELDPGETVTCVFTNVQRGTITIIKNAQPDSEQDFAFSATGSGLSAFSLDDDGDNANTLSNMRTFENLVAGSYSTTEAAVAGWDLTSIDCSIAGGSTVAINGATANLTLAEGGSITCVYVNSKPSINIVKTAGTAADGVEFVTAPGPVTYHYVVTNTGPVALSGIVVSDDNGTPANSADDFVATCPETTLAAAESMECTATVQVTANRTNIGTVTGASGGGTEVEDTDDAVVRVPSVNIDKTADDDLVEPNQTVTYTINVQVVNGPVNNAIVTDTLPVGQTYVANSASPSEPTVSVDGRTLTWNLGTLNDGNPAVTITYDVKIDADATTDVQTNVAQLCISELPNCDTSDEDVTPQKPDIEVVKTAGDAADGEVFSTEPGNVTYTYVVTNTGPLPLQNVTVTDDNGTPGTGDDFAATCPKTTLAADESITCTATVSVTADKTNVATARGVTVEGNSAEDEDDAEVVILTHGLVIAKSNDAPLETLELPDGSTADLPTADEGDTVTYTLHYTFSGDPVTNGIITDVLPVGVTYVEGSATNNAEFTFQAPFDATTRTLTWTAANVTASGTVTYQATVDVGASELSQPLTNIATIDSAQTEPDSDTSDVFVPVIPLGETDVPSAPPTDLQVPGGESAPGSSLVLLLAVLGLLVLGIGFVTPVPAVIRRRNRR